MADIKNILATELTRRHSAIADLAPMIDQTVFDTIATPPPGFKDTQPMSEDSDNNRYYCEKSKNFNRSTSGPHGSIVSPESEQSSQVTSVTNCSDLLQTTGTTFSSDATGSGAISNIMESGTTSDTGSKLPLNIVALSEGPSGLFSKSKMMHGRQMIMGHYNLEFDDDDDEDDDEENCFEDHSGSDQNQFGSGQYRNVDFALAESSSQDEEERAKYELEFETEEEELGVEQFEDDGGPPFEIVSYKKAGTVDPNFTLFPLKKGPLRLNRPSQLPVRKPPLYHDDTNTSDDELEECQVDDAKLNEEEDFPSPPEPSPPPPPMPLPPAEYASTSTNTSTTATRVTHGTSKSLPENLYRSADGAESTPTTKASNDKKLIRTKSTSTFSRRHSRKLSEVNAQVVQLYNQQFDELSLDKSESFRYPQRYESSENRDLTPVHDICSSDPSTTIDLSLPNTVIEKQCLEEEEEATEKGEDMAHNMATDVNDGDAPKFSVEIFDKLNISPDQYDQNGKLSGNKARSIYMRQDTFEDTLDTSYSRREDIPLLLSSGSCDNTIDSVDAIISDGRNPLVNERNMTPPVAQQLPESASDSVSVKCLHCRQPHNHSEDQHTDGDSRQTSRKKNRKNKLVKSKYDSTNQDSYHNGLICKTPVDNEDKSTASTKTSSVDSDSFTLSVENLPEDSTTSGSFMLDDASPFTESFYGIPFLSDGGSGGVAETKYSKRAKRDNKAGKSLEQPTPVEVLKNRVPVSSKSLPSNIDHVDFKESGQLSNMPKTHFDKGTKYSNSQRSIQSVNYLGKCAAQFKSP